MTTVNGNRTVVNGESTISRIAVGILTFVIGAGVVGGVMMYGRLQAIEERERAQEKLNDRREQQLREIRELMGMIDHRGEALPRGGSERPR